MVLFYRWIPYYQKEEVLSFQIRCVGWKKKKQTENPTGLGINFEETGKTKRVYVS